MKLRKLLNITTKKQQLLLEKDAERIISVCNKIARKEIEKQLKLKDQWDGNCLECGATGNDVITQTIILDNDTHYRINHCLKCSNEWDKYQTKKISQTAVLRVALKYLCDIIFVPEHKNFSWKMETLQMFEESYAETIYKLNKVRDGFMFPELKLFLLRKKYKSVFDE